MKPTKFDEPTGPNGEKVMVIRIATSQGDIPVACFGTFTMRFGNLDVLFCLTNDAEETCLEVTDYKSGLRWPVSIAEPSGWKLGLTSPGRDDDPSLQRVIEKAKAIIHADALVKGYDIVAQAIVNNQKRYKTNDVEF